MRPAGNAPAAILLFRHVFPEEHILECWQAEAGGTRVVFDIGANAGIFSLAALAAEQDATVHAFEPTPEIASRLRKLRL